MHDIGQHLVALEAATYVFAFLLLGVAVLPMGGNKIELPEATSENNYALSCISQFSCASFTAKQLSSVRCNTLKLSSLTIR